MNKYEKLGILLDDADTAQKLENVQSYEQMQAMFAAEGIDLTMEEIYAIVAQLQEQSSDELSENDLENVAGGASVGFIKAIFPIRPFIMLPPCPRPNPRPWVNFKFITK